MALVLVEVGSCLQIQANVFKVVGMTKFCLTGDFSQRSRCVRKCNLMPCLRERLDVRSFVKKDKNIQRPLLTVQMTDDK